jgi:cytochrome oxidase assembly protein ShyY1
MTTNSKSSSDQKPPYFATFFTLFVVIALIALGNWQLQRGHQKQQRLDQIAQRKLVSVMTIDEVLSESDRRDLSVEVHGKLLANRIFYLDNRIESGQVGYQILAPIETDSGVLIVNFGWIKAGLYREQLPEIQLTQQNGRFYGTSAEPLVNPMIIETATTLDPWPKVIQSIDLYKISTFLGMPVLPFVMQLDPTHPMGYLRNWQPVVMAPEKHYAYAVQWYGLAIACVIIYLVAIRNRKPKKHV